MPGCLRLSGAITEPTDRTADWLDMRMTGLANLKALNVCLIIASHKWRILCPALVFETSVPLHGKAITGLRYTCTSLPWQKQYWETTPAPFFQNELKVSEIPWQEGSSLSHSKSSMGWFSCLFKMLRIKRTHTLCLWRWHHPILPWRYEWLHH